MVKHSFSSDLDQHDAKEFKETLGTFGTTTRPGGNQLQELQAKIRQGVKHVELHLSSRGKGGSGQLDTPDKYGFEERRTIMQLAKLNKQTMSVHSAMDVVSLSGLDIQNGGFNEVTRLDAIKEMDETIKFASETTKGGAIVMHLQGEGLSQSRSELAFSKKYLKWLKDNGREDEITRLKKDYLVENPLERLFVDNPEKKQEAQLEYTNLSIKEKEDFRQKYKKQLNTTKEEWEVYYLEKQKEKRKISPELNPYVVVGDQIGKVERAQEFVDLDVLTDKKNILTEQDKKTLFNIGIRTGDEMSIEDFQKAMATFTNGIPKELESAVSEKEYETLKNKLFIDYDKILKQNDYIQNQADSEYYEKTTNLNLGILGLQKKNLKIKHDMFKDELKRVKDLEWENREALAKLDKIDGNTEEGKAAKDLIKIHIAEKNREIQQLKYSAIGQEEYHTLANYDETLANLNKQENEIKNKLGNVKSLAESSFERNVSGLAFLGIKTLQSQLDLIEKGEKAKTYLPQLKSELSNLENKYSTATTKDQQDDIFNKITAKKQEIRKWVGLKDYVNSEDGIDIENRPLYIAPENMLPGMGSLTSIEEYKAVLRMGQEEFANKILSDDKEFQQIKAKYEKISGKQIKTKADAMKLAQKHLAGTFDTAHAAAWLKHFKKEEGESEENRLQRFNKWINDEAESLVKEGLVKHIHFNNSTGKDDDHNLISSGVLNMHDMRKRLRKAGVKEALIIEAGGRGADKNMHLLSAFEMFNPSLSYKSKISNTTTSSGVSDWISINRDYGRRPQYSQYGMGYSTFRHIPPQQGKEKGNWSGTSFFNEELI